MTTTMNPSPANSNETNTSATAVAMTDLGAVDTGAGEHLFFLNHLASIKVEAGASDSQMSVVEFTAPRGFGPPLHCHGHEDEIMFVIEGEVSVELGGDAHVATAGTVVSLPHAIPHVFQVLSDEARFLTVTSGASAHPTFDEFVRAMGAPTDPDRLPEPVEIDPGQVAQVAAAHGIEILGPPPAPLD